ncbi:MAG: hypothetical protein ACLQU1_36510 [Bryobacteraceae bacterium]
MRLLVIIVLFVEAANASGRPQEWKAINYAPRGHPYFRMLYDWFSKDAATGREVRVMADADMATLRRSGFNAVHLYLWDQPTFDDLYLKQMSRLLEISGFAYPDPAVSAARQWDALDEFTGLAEKHNLWVIPHFVHTPFNQNLDWLPKTEVQQRADTIATWAGRFISRLGRRHTNILAWGALYALEPAPDDRPENPNNYSLLWRKLYVALKRKIEAESTGDPPPLFTYLYLPSKGRNIWTPDVQVPPGPLEGYALDASVAKRRFASMKRHLSYELGRAAEPDLVYTYLFGPDTAALEQSLRELTTGQNAVPADRLFIAEYGISSPFGAYARAVRAFGENGSPTTDLEGQAVWLRQCLCALRATGIAKSAYWTLYDAAGLWSSPTWSFPDRQVSLNGHWGLAFEDAARGSKPAWETIRAFYSGQPSACGAARAAIVGAPDEPVRFAPRPAGQSSRGSPR